MALRMVADVDLVLHVRNTYLPPKKPYLVFIDGTASLAQRGWDEWRLSRFDYRVRIAQERRYFHSAIAICTAGDHVAREVERHYGIHGDRVAAVGGGTNIDADSLGPIVPQTDRGPLRIVFVGKEFARKGGETLLVAFAEARSQVAGLELIIVGPKADGHVPIDGVHWAGLVTSKDEMTAIYRSAHIFCLPSVFEPYGLAVQEAMAFGLPCVVSDSGALPSIVGAGDAGLIVAAGDVGELSDALVLLASDRNLRTRLGRNGRDLVKSRTWPSVTREITDVALEKTCGGKNSAG